MMKQTVKITAAVFLLSLCACTRSDSRRIDKELAGRYELVRIDGGTVDEGISEEEVSRLKEYGLVCELTLNEDGTAVMNNYGEEQTFSWGGNILSYTDSDEEVQFTAEDSYLTIMDEETSQSLIFEKASSGGEG